LFGSDKGDDSRRKWENREHQKYKKTISEKLTVSHFIRKKKREHIRDKSDKKFIKFNIETYNIKSFPENS